MRGTAKPFDAFVRDTNTDSGVRCLEHDTDWDLCGCWCESDRYCEDCGEWSTGLQDTVTICMWCDSTHLVESPTQLDQRPSPSR